LNFLYSLFSDHDDESA